MLLSEAIRMGGLFGPQCGGTPLERASDGTVSTCALGGAILACGIADGETGIWGDDIEKLEEMFPSLTLWTTSRQTVLSWVVKLNDHLGCKREGIADLIIANGFDCESVGVVEREETKAPEGALAGGVVG